jgi:integrase
MPKLNDTRQPREGRPDTRTRRGNGDGTIARRPGRKTKPWVGRVRLRDGRRPTIYGETKDEVRLEIQRIRAAEADGKPIVITAQRLGDLFQLWLTDSVSKKRPKTAASYESEARRNLLPLLSKRKLSELRPAHVQALVNRLERQNLSPRSVRYNHAILRACIRWGWRMGLVGDRDLASRVEFDDRRVREDGKSEVARKRPIAVLSPKGAAALLQSLSDHDLHPLFAVAIALGLRPAEAIGLRWCDLALEPPHATLTVNQTAQRVRDNPNGDKRKRSRIIFENAAKTEAGTGRVIAIPPPLLPLLSVKRARVIERQLSRKTWADLDLVFPSLRGTALEERRVVKEFKSALDRAGLPVSIRLYDLRHTAASLLYAQGVSPLHIAEILGHSDPGFTLRTYTHTWEELRHEAADKMGAMLVATGALVAPSARPTT